MYMENLNVLGRLEFFRKSISTKYKRIDSLQRIKVWQKTLPQEQVRLLPL